MGYEFIIIGSGPLGIGLAVKLTRLGFGVGFLGRRGPVAISASIIEGDVRSPLSIDAPSDEYLGRARAIFVAVKAYHLAEALEQHRGILPPNVPLISIGNGAVEDILLQFSEKNSKRPVRLGVATLAMSRLGDNEFSLRGTRDRIHWGPLSPKLDPPSEAEAALVQLGKPTFRWHEDPWPLYRKKWLFNAVLNSLAASTRAKSNGALLSDQLKLIRVFAEAYALGTTHWGPWDEPAETVFQELVELIHHTKSNENSMALDVRLGRPTETEFLAGLAEHYDGFPLLKDLNRELRLKEDGGGGLDG